MKWEKVKLGNVTDSCLGKMLDQNKNKGDYQPYLANVNVRWGEFDLEDLPLMKFEESEQERYELKYGDLVICEGGEPGRCAIWKEQIPNMKIQKALHRVRVHDCLDYRYLFYWFLLAGKTGELDQYFTGATIKHMPGQKLKEVVIDKPPLEIQHRIADILSAYDDLIENNQKQIKLLKEAAQRLYKEWFVDLHFPGHENTKIVDGVPEGWSVYPFSSKVDIMSGGTPKTSIPDYYNGKIPFYTPKDSDGAFFAYKTQINITEGGLKNCNSRLYPPKTVIITARGTVGKTTILAVPMAMNQSCYALKMKENDAPYYLFFALNNEIKALQTMANGGVFNTIIGKTFDSINIQIPNDPLIYGFEKTVRPFMEQIKNKLQANSKLVEARDRLLPKLMSGEVKV
jgi:type I restriction enzyme S subunit